MPLAFLSVGLGGFLGSVARYGLSLLFPATAFPFATFIINLLGSFGLGFVAGLDMDGYISSRNFSLFMRVGVFGGFTTFSTFSLESVQLLQSGRTGTAALYMGASLIVCVIGAFAGLMCARFVGK